MLKKHEENSNFWKAFFISQIYRRVQVYGFTRSFEGWPLDMKKIALRVPLEVTPTDLWRSFARLRSWRKQRAKEMSPQRSPRMEVYHRNGRWKRWLTGYGTWKGIDIGGWAEGVSLFFHFKFLQRGSFKSNSIEVLVQIVFGSFDPKKMVWRHSRFLNKSGFYPPEVTFFWGNARDFSRETKERRPGLWGMSRPSRRISSMGWALKL